MAGRTLPGLGLTGFWALGEDGWKDANDSNLLVLSALVQPRVLSIVSADPGAPSNGDIHFFDDAHPTNANKVAIRDNGAWVYIAAFAGMKLFNIADGLNYEFDGTTLVELATSGGGGTATLSITLALSDMTSSLTSGTDAAYWDPPFPIIISVVSASVFEAPTGSSIQIDVNESGSSILSTKITIDDGELRSIDAATPPVISDPAVSGRLTFDIDSVGSGAAGKGAQVTIIYSEAP